MAYYPDLTSYCYISHLIRPSTLNVGWIEGNCFEKGTLSDDVLDKLWRFCQCSIGQTRGFHVCNLPGCEQRTWSAGPHKSSRGEATVLLGSAEIRVFGKNGYIYAAPDMIYHYVIDHLYMPPEEFIEALLISPLPGAQEYFDRLKLLQLEWADNIK